jgi:nitrogenase molybdenum-iron protein NifN
MAAVVASRKACAVNPLKTSAPLGAALAYLGVEGAVPLLHGAQGCTSFALVLLVRHYRESIPLQTTAINEVSAILGGRENLAEAIRVVRERMKPQLIGIASTALVETRGEDFVGDLKPLLQRTDPSAPAVVFASTPDYEGALEDGWAKATATLIAGLVPQTPAQPVHPAGGPAARSRINVLPGVHLTAADLDELRETIEAFDLEPLFLPDLSGSLDGHVPDRWVSTSLGGAPMREIGRMGEALHTIAVGEQMRSPAELLRARTGVPVTVLPTLTGLDACDGFVSLLSRLSRRSAPASLRRRRSQLVDAMLDGHFAFSGRRVAIGADPDLLCALALFVASLGAEVVAAVSSTDRSKRLAELPCDQVVVGDLGDLEDAAAAAGAQLLITCSHGEQAAGRLGVPLLRAGFPIVDRLGVSHRCSVGYRGTRALLFEVANALLAGSPDHAHRSAHPPRRSAAPTPEASHALAPPAVG